MTVVGPRSSPLALLACAAALAGCPRREVQQPIAAPPPTVAGPPVALPDGGVRHTARLALVAWKGSTVGACGRRTRELGERGAIKGCVVVAEPGQPAAPLDWTSERGFVEDRSPVDAAAGDRAAKGSGGCRVLLEDAPGDPGAPPARATLLSPTGRTPLDAWSPPSTVDGDRFAIETSLSPDGRRLALVHTAIGVGDGDLLIEVVSLELRDAPICR